MFQIISLQHWNSLQLLCWLTQDSIDRTCHYSSMDSICMITIIKQVMIDIYLIVIFRFIKKVEHSWKALVHDGVCNFTPLSLPAALYVKLHAFVLHLHKFMFVCVYLTAFFAFQDTVSVHRPSFYADRFLKFMGSTVFKKIYRKLLH